MRRNALNGILTWPLFVVIMVVILLVVAGALSFYRSLEKKTIIAAQDELALLTSLKIDEIKKWRMEHIRDGELISKNTFLITHIDSFLMNDEQKDLREELLVWMETFISGYDYHSIFLLDSVRTIILSFPKEDSLTGNSLLTPAPNVQDYKQIYFSDLHSSPDLKMPHMDLVIPLRGIMEKNIIGTIVMRIDPRKGLLSILNSLPEPSSTSEITLVRRDGDSVVFLNDLRFRKNTSLDFKMSVNDSTLAASMAVRGLEGLYTGKDYRGVEIFADIRKVPDSNWYLIAKTDKAEIYRMLNSQVIFISIIVILLLLSLTVLTGYFLISQRSRIFKELNLMKDRFFSIVSHDLKTPFTSIIGFSELLIHKTRKKELKDIEQYACAINSSSQKAMDLLDNLAEWAGVQSGRTEFKPEIFDISIIIDNVTELLNISAMQKSIKIIRNTPPHLDVIADKTMISTVLRNLISNAIKFSHKDGIIIVSATRSRKEVKVEVKDSGTGMREGVLSEIFRPGSNITTPGTGNEKGTGLGLILCKEFIRMHKGRIWAESKEGQGSSFFFTLPEKTRHKLKTGRSSFDVFS